jgi:lipoprotein-releasing system permease protein
VGGIFDIGNKDLNRRWVFVTLKLAQSLLDLPGGVSNLDLTVADIFEAQRGGRPPSRRHRPQRRELDADQRPAARGAAQPVGVQQPDPQLRGHHRGAGHIASVLVVSVVQKQKEIGILRAMGASSNRIMGIFLLQGALVGFVGALSGVGLAWALLQIFSTVYRTGDGAPIFEPQLDTGIALSAAGIALVVGVLAALIPARRAAKMDPVQAIRS